MINKTLVLVLALTITITLIGSVNARTSRPLTDAEMTGVYGGGGGGSPDYYHCLDYGQGCAGIEYTGDCSGSSDPNVPSPWPGGSGGCDGSWKTSCKQEQIKCLENVPLGEGECSSSSGGASCTGTYDRWTCGIQNEECEVDYSATYDCTGTKWWCNEW